MISAIDSLDSASTSQKKKNCEKIVQLLIRRGASPNKAKTDGFAPIHVATMRGLFILEHSQFLHEIDCIVCYAAIFDFPYSRLCLFACTSHNY